MAPPGDGRAQAVDLWFVSVGGFRFSGVAGFSGTAAAQPPASEYVAAEAWAHLSADTWSFKDRLEALFVIPFLEYSKALVSTSQTSAKALMVCVPARR